jgi:hypothetical protein
MQKMKFPCVIVIPVGPNADISFVNDTLRSVFEHCRPNSKVSIIDNSTDGLSGAAIHRRDEIHFIRCERDPGANPLYGGLYFNLSKAWRVVLDTYDFEAVLRLDDDALLIGSGADEEAIMFFAQHPEVGALGSYRVTCTGSKRDFTPARKILRSETSIISALKNPARWKFLRHLRNLARRNGYEDGEHCLGAATFYSKACLEAFRSLGFLERAELRNSNLGEDHLFGMMVRAAGLKMEDFATGKRPMGLAWKGLPASPATLLEMGKKIVHSVKSFGDLDQRGIRAEFRRLTAGASDREIG